MRMESAPQADNRNETPDALNTRRDELSGQIREIEDRAKPEYGSTEARELSSEDQKLLMNLGNERIDVVNKIRESQEGGE